METRVIKVSADNFDASIEEAAEIIRAGGVVGMPTETVYGLAASAFDSDAVGRIFQAKGRPGDNPLIVHICDYVMLKSVVKSVPDDAAKLARKFWPGPLTIVLPKSDNIVAEVTCSMDTVAVRMPSHPVAAELIRHCSVPLAAPSANLSGRPSTTTAAHVLADMDGRIPLILDGGACDVGIESTVISFVGEVPTVLRPGIISLPDIKEIVPTAVMSEYATKPVAAGDAVESPGLKHTHYSPKAAVVLVRSSLEDFSEYVNERNVLGAFAMCFNGDRDMIDIPSVSYGDADDPRSLAKRLFATLRALDGLNAQCIYVRCPKDDEQSLAVFNRLIRAAGFDLVEL